jgi:hypothetical protein
VHNWLKENSRSSVAKYTPTGIFTKPKLILPFHVFEGKRIFQVIPELSF